MPTIEEKVQALETKQGEMEGLIVAKDVIITTLSSDNERLVKENDVLVAEKMELDKNLKIEQANRRAEHAKTEMDRIQAEVFENDTTMHESWHPTVLSTFNHKQFMTAEGFDGVAYKEAFAAHAKDWNGKLPQGATLGLGDVKKDDIKPIVPHSEENAAVINRVVRVKA